MSGHLRADLIRLRARWDVRGFIVLVPLVAMLGYVLAYTGIESQYGLGSGGQVPPEVAAQFKAQIAAEQAQYAFPHSLLAALNNAPWVLFGLFFLVATTLGLEFGWGTIRTVLISSPERGRLVASRLLATGAIAVYTLVALLVVGAVMPFLMRAAGVVIPASPETPAAMIVVSVVAAALAAALLVTAGALLAVLTRSPALPLLVLILDLLVELVLAGNPVVEQAGLKQVVGSLPLNSVTLLLEGAHDPAAYGLPPLIQPPPTADRPLALSFAVTAGWTVALLLLTRWHVRRTDILE